MLKTYYDSGVLVKLYVREWLSDVTISYVSSQGRSISFNGLQELEVKNALRLKAFRSEIRQTELRKALQAITDDLASGLMVRSRTRWQANLAESESVSSRTSVRLGGRSLDILHIAIALLDGFDSFVSVDDRQMEVASDVGLNVVDLRDANS